MLCYIEHSIYANERLNEPTAAKIECNFFFDMRNKQIQFARLTKIYSALSSFPRSFQRIARRKDCVSRFWRRDSVWWESRSPKKYARVSRRLRFCIMDVISGNMKFEQTPDISGASSLFTESNAQICRHSKPGCGNCHVQKQRREMPGASLGARQGAYVNWWTTYDTLYGISIPCLRTKISESKLVDVDFISH